MRAAAAAWRFLPARHGYRRKNANGDAVYDHAEAVESETDLRFVFAPVRPPK